MRIIILFTWMRFFSSVIRNIIHSIMPEYALKTGTTNGKPSKVIGIIQISNNRPETCQQKYSTITRVASSLDTGFVYVIQTILLLAQHECWLVYSRVSEQM